MVRLIGVVGLIACLAILNLVASDLLHNQDMTDNVEILFGLEWRDFLPFQDRSLPKNKVVPISILTFVILHAATHLCLIFASVMEISWLTYPWLLTNSAGIACQTFSLIVHVTQKHDYQAALVSTATTYIVISAYCWIVVFVAQMQWYVSLQYSFTEQESNTLKNELPSAIDKHFEEISPYNAYIYTDIN